MCWVRSTALMKITIAVWRWAILCPVQRQAIMFLFIQPLLDGLGNNSYWRFTLPQPSPKSIPPERNLAKFGQSELTARQWPTEQMPDSYLGWGNPVYHPDGWENGEQSHGKGLEGSGGCQLKLNQQCALAAKRVKFTLQCIKARTATRWGKGLLFVICTVLSHFKHWGHVWVPQYKSRA